jgi:hypothetical protein
MCTLGRMSMLSFSARYSESTRWPSALLFPSDVVAMDCSCSSRISAKGFVGEWGKGTQCQLHALWICLGDAIDITEKILTADTGGLKGCYEIAELRPC